MLLSTLSLQQVYQQGRREDVIGSPMARSHRAPQQRAGAASAALQEAATTGAAVLCHALCAADGGGFDRCLHVAPDESSVVLLTLSRHPH